MTSESRNLLDKLSNSIWHSLRNWSGGSGVLFVLSMVGGAVVFFVASKIPGDLWYYFYTCTFENNGCSGDEYAQGVVRKFLFFSGLLFGLCLLTLILFVNFLRMRKFDKTRIEDAESPALGAFESEAETSDLSEILNRSLLSHSTNRISKYILELKDVARDNLLIGAMIAAFGVMVLVVTISSSGIDSDTPSDVVRSTLAIFIQSAAFFFLNTYRAALKDVKYYQNELTNLELKIYALKYAHYNKLKENEVRIVDEFSLTERNFPVIDSQDNVSTDVKREEGLVETAFDIARKARSRRR